MEISFYQKWEFWGRDLVQQVRCLWPTSECLGYDNGSDFSVQLPANYCPWRQQVVAYVLGSSLPTQETQSQFTAPGFIQDLAVELEYWNPVSLFLDNDINNNKVRIPNASLSSICTPIPNRCNLWDFQFLALLAGITIIQNVYFM